MAPVELGEEFLEKEIGFRDNLAIGLFDLQVAVKNNSDNLPLRVNPTLSPNSSPSQVSPSENNPTQQPTTNQPIKEGNTSENQLENDDKSSVKKAEIVNSEVENKFWVIDLKNIKQITLRDGGKLEIEFNSVQTGDNWYSISQVISTEQINNNQELQTIRNYCQQNGKDSLSQQELNNILNTNSTNTKQTDNPTDNNSLTIGLSITAVLIAGLAIGLILKRKKRVKRS